MKRHPWRIAITIGVVLGALAAALSMFAAWDHNPQGEFHASGNVHWRSLLAVGGSWFVALGTPSALMARAVLFVLSRNDEPGAA